MNYRNYHDTREMVRQNVMQLFNVHSDVWPMVETGPRGIQLSDDGKQYIERVEKHHPEFPYIYTLLTEPEHEFTKLYRKYKDNPNTPEKWLFGTDILAVAKTLEAPEQLKQMCASPIQISEVHKDMATRLLRYSMIVKICISDEQYFAATCLGSYTAKVIDFK